MRVALPCLALAALLAGCDRKSSTQSIDLWIVDWNVDTRDLLNNTILPDFEKKHGVKVRVQYLDWGHLDEKLTISFAGGVQPDVFQVGAEYVGSMAYRGQAMMLDEFMKDWPQHKDFIPAAWDTVCADGHVYGVPYLSAPRVLVYRKDLMQSAGLPTPPKTWDEWVTSGLKLKKLNARGNVVRTGINLSSGANWSTFITFLWQNGGKLLTPDHRRAAFNSPEGVEALTFLCDLYNKHKVCPREGIPSAAANVPLFAGGQTAQEVTNQFVIKNVIKYAKDFTVNEVAVSPAPYSKRPVVTVWTDWLAISSGTKKKELAWELVKHLTRPDNLIKYNETQYFLPPLRSARNSDYVRNTPFMTEYFDLMDNYGMSLPPIPEWFEIRAGLRNAVDQAVYGAKTPKQSLDDYAKQVDELIAQRERSL